MAVRSALQGGISSSAIPPASPRIFNSALGCIAAFTALAGRLTLIRDFGTSLPYKDQWRITAIDVLKPWIAGDLSFASFFQQSNGHWNVLGRLYSFLLTAGNGQWNNLLEITVGALLYAAFIFFFVGTIAAALDRTTAIVVSLFAGWVLGMPFTWENTLMGLQVEIFLQIGLSIFYLWAMTMSAPFSRAWWLAQLAAGLVLFSLRSGVLAFAPAALWHLWLLVRSDERRRDSVAGLVSAGGWILAFFILTPAFDETAEMKASSWRLWLDVTLRQLAWPLPHPGWAIFVQLPGIWFILDRLGRRQVARRDAFLMTLVLWAAAQAAAIGYGRGEITTGFVSRYCELLTWGVIGNTACLALLLRSYLKPAVRTLVGIFAIGWASCCLWGVWTESVTGHTRYNLERRLSVNADNLAAVKGYLSSGNPAFLSAGKIGESLYSYPPAIAELLQAPRFRALLPPDTGAREARPDYGRFGSIVTAPLRIAPWVALTIAGFALWRVLSRPSKPAENDQRLAVSDWNWSRVKTSAIIFSALVWLGLLAWREPFTFAPQKRWQSVLTATTAGEELPVVNFASTVGRPVRAEELDGAVSTVPAIVRPFMKGTLLDGLAYTGIVRSEPVRIDRHYLYALITGWPNWPGNAIRWQVTNPRTGRELWLPVLGSPSEPGDGVMLWTENVTNFQGWTARLFLFDGNVDDRGWVGISQPVMTNDRDFGENWVSLQHSERAETTHRLLAFCAGFTVVGWALATVLGWYGRTAAVPLRPIVR